MGRQITRRIADDDGVELVGAVAAQDSPDVGHDMGLLAGVSPLNVSVLGSNGLSELLDKTKPDVAIDFTLADACIENAGVVAGRKINMVVGTTGFSDGQRKKLEKLIKDGGVGAVVSPNMSVGVNVYWKIVGELTKALKDHDYDIEVVEAHHRFKKDAPSGTAVKTAEVIADSLGVNSRDAVVYGREGLSPRKKGEIGLHAVRAGDIVGEHTVVYSTLGERLELTHRAHSRDAFAGGVLEAAKFIKGRKGLYSMKDVLGL